MKFWQSLAFCEPEQVAEIAGHAEELGFEGVTLAEHQFFPERIESRFPFSEDGAPLFDSEDEWPEMWTLIGAMTTTTRRLRFCSAVHILPLVHPLSTARVAATAERMAPGRIVLGVGAGWMREEYDAYGVDFGSRGRRLEEGIGILRQAWTGETFDHRGDAYDFDRLRVRPAPSAPIPVWIGGGSDAALRRTARIAEGWLGGGGSGADLIALLDRLRTLRAEVGRTDHAFEAITLHAVGLQRNFDEVHELEAAGLTGLVNLPFRATLGRTSTVSEKKRTLDRFAEDVIRVFD